MKLVRIEDQSDMVEILVFNYDGQGSALVRYKDSELLEHCSLSDLKDMLLGAVNSERKYKIL